MVAPLSQDPGSDSRLIIPAGGTVISEEAGLLLKKATLDELGSARKSRSEAVARAERLFHRGPAHVNLLGTTDAMVAELTLSPLCVPRTATGAVLLQVPDAG